MRIGIEAQRIFRKKKHGMDFVVLETIRQLQRADHSNDYFIFINEGEDHCLQETENFKLVIFAAPYPYWEQVRLPKMVRHYQCDLLHLTSNTGPLRSPVPTLLILHDIIYYEKKVLFRSGYTPYQRLGNLYRQMVVRKVAQRAERIYTVSNFERKNIIKTLGISPRKISTIYNGVGDHFLREVNVDQIDLVRKRYKLPDNYLLFLGNTDPKKNTPNTLRAFARYCEEHTSDFQLVVADLDRQYIAQALAAVGLEHQLGRFVSSGYIDNNDLPAVMAGAELFLYTSLRESFGIPILESLAVSTPVITSKTSSMPEVGGAAVELVDPEDVNMIASSIHQLLQDSARREQLKALGRERVQQFGWPAAVKKVMSLYQEIG